MFLGEMKVSVRKSSERMIETTMREKMRRFDVWRVTMKENEYGKMRKV